MLYCNVPSKVILCCNVPTSRYQGLDQGQCLGMETMYCCLQLYHHHNLTPLNPLSLRSSSRLSFRQNNLWALRMVLITIQRMLATGLKEFCTKTITFVRYAPIFTCFNGANKRRRLKFFGLYFFLTLESL